MIRANNNFNFIHRQNKMLAGPRLLQYLFIHYNIFCNDQMMSMSLLKQPIYFGKYLIQLQIDIILILNKILRLI